MRVRLAQREYLQRHHFDYSSSELSVANSVNRKRGVWKGGKNDGGMGGNPHVDLRIEHDFKYPDKKMDVGYARVSTQDQDTDMQLRALRAAGVTKVFSESTSSVGKRPELQKALASIQKNDVLVVYKLDRLARSLRDLLKILDALEFKGARFKSLTESVDTSTPAGRMMMQLLGAFAEFERSLIRERSMAGQLAARARGNYPGRPKSVDPVLEIELAKLYLSGWYTYAMLALMFDLHPASVKRAVYRTTKPGHSSLL